MIGLYYGLSALIIITIISLYFLSKTKKLNIDIKLLTKILSAILAVVFFVRFMWDDVRLDSVLELNNSLFDNKAMTVISIILNWLLNASILLVVLFPFYKVKTQAVVKYFCFITGLLSFGFMHYVIVGVAGEGAFYGFNLRALLMSIEIAILIGQSFIVFMQNNMFKIKKKEALSFLYILPMLIFIMPSYIPSALFGFGNPLIEIDGLSLWHRVFLYFSFIVPIIIFIVLKNKNLETKKFMLLYLSLSALTVFISTYRFQSWLDPTSWPIHLCHTAMYIIPLCIIFKWDKIFYFTFFINVLGAFLAMAMPNTTGNVLSYGVLHFWSNHYFAFFMPLLLVALSIYKRPKLRQFIYSAIAFTIYFVLIAFINAWFSNYGEVDFFFINSDFIADKLGTWAENLRNVTFTFNIGNLKFVLYPLYQFLYWLVYVIASAGMWFLYETSYNYFDLMKDLFARKKKYKLDELALMSQLNGREKEEPLYMENMNKMILHDFTKIYGKSNVYAVKDANLEIYGGEIFGFLGPNGAGKSTIIKSIVGIQPITNGSIEVCGYDVDKQSVMAKKQIGFVPDHYALYEKLTGREYINYIADLYEVSQEDRDKRINNYVKIFELQTAFDNQMKTYSHGMKQKIAIMAALVHNPKVWILDEPLTGLDPNSIFQVKECMKQHAKEGNIVFFSSHIIDVVEKICDRIGIIKKGQIQCVKTVKEIEDSGKSLEEFYMNIIENNKVEAIAIKNSDKNESSKVVGTSKQKKGVKNVD